jgi:hypothetical protein
VKDFAVKLKKSAAAFGAIIAYLSVAIGIPTFISETLRHDCEKMAATLDMVVLFWGVMMLAAMSLLYGFYSDDDQGINPFLPVLFLIFPMIVPMFAVDKYCFGY